MSAIEAANQQQLAASDPLVSAFVAASAGSGKTKLLTDRLLRLMLTGSAPDKILCLTYTKAAAAEMRIRLNRRLGEWVTLPHEVLRDKLIALNITPAPEILARARQLFADVLDLPGGMRIETIHAFCQSLLRRFPLEAQLSPYFSVADDTAAAQRLREARERILSDFTMRSAITTLAAEIDEQRFVTTNNQFVQKVELNFLKQNLVITADHLRDCLGVEDDDEDSLLKSMLTPPAEVALRACLQQVAQSGTPTGQKWAYAGLDWLAGDTTQRRQQIALWKSTLFTKTGDILTLSKHFGKSLKDQADFIRAEVKEEALRWKTLEDKIAALELVKINLALLTVLTPIALADRDKKIMAAELSYADLIAQTSQLLVDPGAAWVLYKLDGGIEHLLLDEVQDTAPEQWKIANAIAREFFVGLGAQKDLRSIFAVGDPKQSIFSFQGADLKSFETYRKRFKNLAQEAGQKWLDGVLSVSFRSTAPVLALTDAVFDQGFARQGVLMSDERLQHGVSRLGQAGSATLWPLTQTMDATEVPDWEIADEYQQADSSVVLLARQIVDYIEQRLRQVLPAKNRNARPGDFLILVRSRGPIVAALTSELKARFIDVAGLDRMILPDQPVVSDMLALCDALLLPDDDLAFAQFLASPLGGLSDDSLMDLAMNRKGSLVEALYARSDERDEWRLSKAFFESLRAKADFETPFSLLSEALGSLGGRARLLMRFGAEAAEPLDELLTEALAYTLQNPASLQGFVQYVRISGQAIKRESETGGNEVRIMTVHGAKGLQAPIVILPDTVSLPKADAGLFWMDNQKTETKIPVFCPRADLSVPALRQEQEFLRQAQIEEYNRLLYVALTRAEDEILICGAKGRREIPEACWYEAIKSGFLRLEAQVQEDGSRIYRSAQTAKPDGESKVFHKKNETLPDWAGSAPDWRAIAPEKDKTSPERITPSRAVEEKSRAALAISPLALEPFPAAARAVAMARGSAIHALLQHLPRLPAAAQEQAALAYLRAHPSLVAHDEQICASVLKILHDPALVRLFGPGSGAEIPLAGVVAGREISGEADRIFIGAGEIIIADYKTDKNPPSDAASIPEKYLFQLAAYRAVLRQIHADKAVSCILIWTETAQAMAVPDAQLDKAWPA